MLGRMAHLGRPTVIVRGVVFEIFVTEERRARPDRLVILSSKFFSGTVKLREMLSDASARLDDSLERFLDPGESTPLSVNARHIDGGGNLTE